MRVPFIEATHTLPPSPAAAEPVAESVVERGEVEGGVAQAAAGRLLLGRAVWPRARRRHRRWYGRHSHVLPVEVVEETLNGRAVLVHAQVVQVAQVVLWQHKIMTQTAKLRNTTFVVQNNTRKY